MKLFQNKMKLYQKILHFSEGRAVVIFDDKYGYIDEQGEEVIPCIYRDATSFSGGLGKVSSFKSNFYGFIDIWGKEIIPCIYDYAYNFKNDKAIIQIGDEWGIINKYNQTVLPAIYQYIELTEYENVYKVLLKDKQGYLYIPYTNPYISTT